MKTIESTATVASNGKVILHTLLDVPPGEHKIVLVIDETPLKATKRRSLEIPSVSVGKWPSELSLRREEIYGDNGR